MRKQRRHTERSLKTPILGFGVLLSSIVVFLLVLGFLIILVSVVLGK